MDPELRDAFKDLREVHRSEMAELRGMLSNMSDQIVQHVEHSASRWSVVDQMAKAAHSRLDEHLKDHRSWLSMKGAVLLGVGTTVLTLIVTIILAILKK